MFSENEIMELKNDAMKFICPHFANNAELAKGPKIFVKGDGCYVYDIEGKKYLDTFASLLTTVCGHNRKEIIDAINKQLGEMEFFPNYYDTFSVPQVKLARKLAEIMPGDLSVTFFVNSGSEACETAIKMALQYHWEKGDKNRYKILGRRYSYHGTTLGGVSATGLSWFRETFQPLMPGFIHGMSTRCNDCEMSLELESCKLACLKSLEDQIKWEGPASVAAIIIDPIPGSNTGYPVPPDGYLQGLRNLCDKFGILLIFDEVQTGFGKSGKMFACEHWNVVPDFMAIGKGFSGGYVPLGAVVTTPKIYKEFSKKPGCELRSGSTFGGHNLACAAALANIEVIEKEKLVENATVLGKYIKDRLEEMKEYSIVGDVRGIGLLLAVELMADREKKIPLDPKLGVGNFIRDYCYNNGMIMRNNGDIMVIAPALTLSRFEADFMLDLLAKAIKEAEKQFDL
ncbi:MAG: aspartate aminotransferase family protein [Clostridiales bacterium]|nr:aspartate aminotransferase family protein [Clostridiales bacterium]